MDKEDIGPRLSGMNGIDQLKVNEAIEIAIVRGLTKYNRQMNEEEH